MAWKPKTQPLGSSGTATERPIPKKGKDRPKADKPKPHRASLVKHPDDKPEKRADEFPNISTFDEPDMKQALALMQTDIEYAEQEKILKQARDEGKKGLYEIAVKYGVDGMRWGQLAVYNRGMVSRPSCKIDDFIEALLEEGVDVDVITTARAAATKDGKEFLDLQVKDLTPKPKG